MAWMKFLVLLSLLLASCMSSREGLQKVVLSDGSREIPLWVELADDPPEQARGLMERTELGPDRGMLFIFPAPRPLSFWMKNTRIPLDALFFDEQGAFVNVQTMDPCLDPCPTYSSGKPVKYALEVNAGFAEEQGIKRGWRLEL